MRLQSALPSIGRLEEEQEGQGASCDAERSSSDKGESISRCRVSLELWLSLVVYHDDEIIMVSAVQTRRAGGLHGLLATTWKRVGVACVCVCVCVRAVQQCAACVCVCVLSCELLLPFLQQLPG